MSSEEIVDTVVREGNVLSTFSPEERECQTGITLWFGKHEGVGPFHPAVNGIVERWGRDQGEWKRLEAWGRFDLSFRTGAHDAQAILGSVWELNHRCVALSQ